MDYLLSVNYLLSVCFPYISYIDFCKFFNLITSTTMPYIVSAKIQYNFYIIAIMLIFERDKYLLLSFYFVPPQPNAMVVHSLKQVFYQLPMLNYDYLYNYLRNHSYNCSYCHSYNYSFL